MAECGPQLLLVKSSVPAPLKRRYEIALVFVLLPKRKESPTEDFKKRYNFVSLVAPFLSFVRDILLTEVNLNFLCGSCQRQAVVGLRFRFEFRHAACRHGHAGLYNGQVANSLSSVLVPLVFSTDSCR